MTVAAGEVLRLGCVEYLNARPLIFGWPGAVDFDKPSALCRKLAAGELDVAFVSSFEFLRQPDYTIVDEVAVGCDGPVYSVILAHQQPLGEVEEIELDPASSTSVNLLRCLLAESQLRPRLLAQPNEFSPRRARLLIGDPAIRFRQEEGDAWIYRDLGEWWKELTGLPFVFALWLIRPEVRAAAEIAHRLRALRDENLAAIERVVAAEENFSPEFCRFYLGECLRFGFGEREKQGLRKFRQLCERHGILPPHDAPLRLA